MTLETAAILSGLLGRMSGGAAVQLLARSPEAPMAKAVLGELPKLAARGAAFEAVFLQAGEDVFAKVAAAYGAETARRSVRVLQLADPGEMSEQVNFGAGHVWTGRKLKAAPAVFAEGALKTAGEGSDKAKLAAAAFRAVWTIAKVPPAAWTFSEAPANDAGPADGLRVVSSR